MNDSDYAWDTWRTTAGPQGCLWLRDGLHHISEARIFLYQYKLIALYRKDRDIFIGKANELLEAIRIKREGVYSRRIMFLGHSVMI